MNKWISKPGKKERCKISHKFTLEIRFISKTAFRQSIKMQIRENFRAYRNNFLSLQKRHSAVERVSTIEKALGKKSDTSRVVLSESVQKILNFSYFPYCSETILKMKVENSFKIRKSKKKLFKYTKIFNKKLGSFRRAGLIKF